MASRRMFSKRLINSAKFLKMPISSQALYFHLGLHADDDGIVEAYPILNSVGCSEDDLRVLVTKNFVQVLNEDLVTYITDWNENNKIRADRKIDSIYRDLLLSVNPTVELLEKKPRADQKQIKDGQWTTNGQPMDGIGKDRLGKDRLGKDRLDISSESKKDSEQEYADVPAIPLNNSTEWKMPLALYEEYKKIYPAVDIQKEVGKMRMWSMANPTKRKTPKGITRFVNSWLSKEQDRYHGNANTTNYEDIH